MTIGNQGDIYSELGITPIINAIGSVTMLGGSTPIPEVTIAMERAGESYIPLIELEEKAGAVVADMIDVPAAYITSGAGSALTLAAAAVMAGDDDNLIQQLPDTTGMKNEILIQKRQRYWYDRCLEASGARLVNFGTDDETTREDLFNAITENTAAVHFYMVEQEPDSKALSLEETIEIAHEKGVPVLVDAAGQIYPLDLFGKYVRMGADFQCIAAKYMGASQSTGLALGTEEMIRKISKQSFVGYEGRRIRGIGRPHKVDRQEMVGVVAAVRHWMTINHEERLASIEKRSGSIIKILTGIDGVQVSMMDNIIGHQPFGVQLRINEKITGLSLQDIVDELKAGPPPIWTRVREDEDFISLHIFGLKEGEEEIVGSRIAELLR
ncbi:aminotransferase class V-fold PLP-dependent enzyme [SAR202 cluster bacterium AD-802-K11_MRT_200m]|nr:aminotransferase class V-fold PLP-dependent enzyme [SAR202 cluster bacterium AD-802-K11_MRT_200m]